MSNLESISISSPVPLPQSAHTIELQKMAAMNVNHTSFGMNDLCHTAGLVPHNFSITLELQDEEGKKIIHPQLWKMSCKTAIACKDPKFQKRKIDFFDLPGLESVAMITGTEHDKRSYITLTFCDLANMAERTANPNDLQLLAQNETKPIQHDQMGIIKTMELPLPQAYGVILAARLAQSGKLPQEEAESRVFQIMEEANMTDGLDERYVRYLLRAANISSNDLHKNIKPDTERNISGRG